MSGAPIDRRRFLIGAGTAGATFLAGCSSSDGNGGDGSDGSSGGGDGGSDETDSGSSDERSYLDDEPDYDGWLESAKNYDGTVDFTDQDDVTVLVGYDSLAFDPAAIAVSTGTTVTWEWTGEGGSHNVTSKSDGPLESDTTEEEGHTYSHTFDESGTYPYSCTPHEAAGMKGAVYVE